MIRELIEAKALELAIHDGVPATVMHIHAAASHLVGEIAREKEFLVAALGWKAPGGRQEPAHAAPEAAGPALAASDAPAIDQGAGNAPPAPANDPPALQSDPAVTAAPIAPQPPAPSPRPADPAPVVPTADPAPAAQQVVV